MASSSNRKSSSSASSAKPTFRKAGGGPRSAKPSARRPRSAASAPASRKRGPASARPSVRSSVSGSGTARSRAGAGGRPRPAAAPAARRPSGARRSRSFELPAIGPALRRARVVLIAVACLIAVAAIGLFVVANTGVFAVTEIQVVGTEHVSEETVSKLLKVPEGTTLLNVNEDEILSQLKKDPWVKGVDVKREFPHKIVITPVEHSVTAIAYISTADVAWAVSEEGTWIAPVSLSAPAEADGEQAAGEQEDGAAPEEAAPDGAAPEEESDGGQDGEDGAPQADAGDEGQGDAEADGSAQEGYDAALAVAQEAGALLITDIGTDIEPKSGEQVQAAGVLAAIDYANGFSEEFREQVKSFSAPSVESLSLYTDAGVEISLGAADDISYKETVIERILSENPNVTYINVRTPDSPTWRTVSL